MLERKKTNVYPLAKGGRVPRESLLLSWISRLSVFIVRCVGDILFSFANIAYFESSGASAWAVATRTVSIVALAWQAKGQQNASVLFVNLCS